MHFGRRSLSGNLWAIDYVDNIQNKYLHSLVKPTLPLLNDV